MYMYSPKNLFKDQFRQVKLLKKLTVAIIVQCVRTFLISVLKSFLLIFCFIFMVNEEKNLEIFPTVIESHK